MQVGVAKQISGSVVAVDANGNQRVLKTGDAIYMGEVIRASGDSKAVLSMDSGKEISVGQDDTLLVDSSVAQNSSFGPDAVVADLSDLQKAILDGADLTQLEETAAGGGAAGGGSGTAQINPAYFADGGHYSNINADYRGLGDNGNGGLSPFSSVAGAPADLADIDETTLVPNTPSQVSVSVIEIPSSAYIADIASSFFSGSESTNAYFKALNANSATNKTYAVENTSNMIADFVGDIPAGFSITKALNANGFEKAYLEYPAAEFTLKNGWYISNDGTILIGGPDAEPITITTPANASKYSGFVFETTQVVSVYGSDKSDQIIIDGVELKVLSSGTGDDYIAIENSVIQKNLILGSGDDKLILDKNSVVKGSVIGGEGDDSINIKGGEIGLDVQSNAGKDNITIDGAKIVYGINAGMGDDVIDVSNSSIGIAGQSGTGYVAGLDGDDLIISQNNNITWQVQGGNGDDTIISQGGIVETIGGNAGNDTIKVTDTTVRKDVLGGNGTIYNNAGDGDDSIYISKSTIGNVVQGNLGNDKIVVVDSKAGYIDGNEGDDDINVKGSEINLQTKSYVSGGIGNDSVVVENSKTNYVNGSDGNDDLKVLNSNVANSIIGGNGDDSVLVANSSVGGVVTGQNGSDTVVSIDSTTGAKTAFESLVDAHKVGTTLIIDSISNSSDTIELSKLNDHNTDTIDLNNVGNVKLSINPKDLLEFGKDEIVIKGGADDKITLSDMTKGTSDGTYTEYSSNNSSVIVKIDDQIQVDL
ncbi:retention module-containing protein [Campylobacter mucosalis]|uniref:retention module-containing protein n=1 Tax=Campylobacter mucosalis TaxID=202 RepID=UPI0014703DA4|nr:retention module-containing protein [Campylobacter mucosalis]